MRLIRDFIVPPKPATAKGGIEIASPVAPVEAPSSPVTKGLSANPRSHITLRAGNMFDVNARTKVEERVGSYAWAQFGFDFADQHGLGVFTQYGGRIPGEDATIAKLSTLQLVQRRFMEFVDAHIKAGTLPNDPQVRDALQDAASAFKHPWEIASFHVDGMTIPVEIGGKKVDTHLGKAFLTSDQSVSWDGAIFPNHQLIRDPNAPKSVAASAFEALIRREGVTDKTLAVFTKSPNMAQTLDRMPEDVLSALWRWTREEEPLGAAVRSASYRKWDERRAAPITPVKAPPVRDT